MISPASTVAAVGAPPPSAPRRLRLAGGKECRREVAGESNYQQALSDLCGGYARDGHRLACLAALVPDPSNPYDAFAVRVEIDEQLVGYLPATDAARFTSQLAAAGHPGETAWVDALIVGGWRTNQHDVGHFGVRLNFSWPVTPIR